MEGREACEPARSGELRRACLPSASFDIQGTAEGWGARGKDYGLRRGRSEATRRVKVKVMALGVRSKAIPVGAGAGHGRREGPRQTPKLLPQPRFDLSCQPHHHAARLASRRGDFLSPWLGQLLLPEQRPLRPSRCRISTPTSPPVRRTRASCRASPDTPARS
jgi:hypothetical protein